MLRGLTCGFVGFFEEDFFRVLDRAAIEDAKTQLGELDSARVKSPQRATTARRRTGGEMPLEGSVTSGYSTCGNKSMSSRKNSIGRNISIEFICLD